MTPSHRQYILNLQFATSTALSNRHQRPSFTNRPSDDQLVAAALQRIVELKGLEAISLCSQCAFVWWRKRRSFGIVAPQLTWEPGSCGRSQSEDGEEQRKLWFSLVLHYKQGSKVISEFMLHAYHFLLCVFFSLFVSGICGPLNRLF